MTKGIFLRGLLLLLLTASVRPAGALDIRGAGATFPAPLYLAWGSQYARQSGTRLFFEAQGSGIGLDRIRAHSVDFGASDVPMTPEELQQYDLLQFPTVVGGVVPVINIAGIQPGELRLTGAVLAQIYLGKVKRWNDRVIAELNPTIRLPAANITVVHRAEPSGSTLLWTSYLSHISPDWARDVGASLSPRWPVGVAGTGNGGVASYVQRTRFTIGYVEYFYSRDHHLSDVLLRNRSGAFVQASRDTFRAASEAIAWTSAQTMLQLAPDREGEHCWPITGASFILMPMHTEHAEQARATLAFFDWALHAGATTIDSLDYVPIPATALAQLTLAWRSVTDRAGREIWP
jgi:phosphate transport system substrate-binding protein